MSGSNEYIVMGEDGKEYGPVDARQIRQWIVEGRLENKTPVKPGGARDWVFLYEVPEFSRLFQKSRAARTWVPPRRGLVKALVIVAAVTAIYYLFQHFHLLEKLHRR